ncbi:sialic acid-binding Ig-like lectin 5 [Eptesicus fuscus]|uniref:sialic acid-binding Ig-like lectin 5 n=1 Tax=Eptesicus fuscus TaxID=29078 RepID=UPI00240489C4|nr:sialic acid-binding Ig-like lectin 5 [Eptesicus fuscus]
MVPLLLLPLLWGGSLQQPPDYELRVQDSVTVQEGLCVHVPCSFSYPRSLGTSSSKVFTYWYREGDRTNRDAPVASTNPDKAVNPGTQGRFLLADRTTNDCSLQIRDARRSDAGRYYFRVEIGIPDYNYQGYFLGYTFQGYSYQDKTLYLQVTALTEKPHIRIPEPLESGRPTQLACSLPGACEGGRPLTFSWAGAAVDSLDPRTLSSSVLTFTPRPRDHGTNLTCQVQVQGSSVATQRTIRLNVSYATGNLTIGVSFRKDTAFKNLQNTSLTILEGEDLRLHCLADSNPPAELSWFRGSPGLNATPISSTAILELPRVGPAQEGEFTCQAGHPLGPQSVSLSLSVVYPPQLLGPSCSWEYQGLHCSCSSRAQPAPSLRWRLGAGLLEGNHGNGSHVVTSSSEGPWTNSSLRLNDGLSPDLRLSCEARNVHGAQSASVLLLPGKAVSQVGLVPAALGGAGAMALLSLCLCLLFFCIVKARKRQAAGRQKVTNDEDPVMGTVTWGSKKNLQPDGPPDQASPAEKGPLSGEQQELYYANLTFEGMKPREPRDQAATSTHEYSEIKRAGK